MPSKRYDARCSKETGVLWRELLDNAVLISEKTPHSQKKMRIDQSNSPYSLFIL